MRVPAAIVITTGTSATNGASACAASRICCGFTASTTRSAPSIAPAVGSPKMPMPGNRVGELVLLRRQGLDDAEVARVRRPWRRGRR